MTTSRKCSALCKKPEPAIRAVSVVQIPLDEIDDAALNDNTFNDNALNIRPLNHDSLLTSASKSARVVMASAPLNTGFLSHLARTVCVWLFVRPLQAVVALGKTLFASPVPMRATMLAGFAFIAAVISTHMVAGEIDLTKLLPGAQQTDGRPVIVVRNGRLANTGTGPAMNLEVTSPRYRLLGTLAAGQDMDLPANDFSVRFEWSEGSQVKRATRSFKVGAPGNTRVAGAVLGVADVAQAGASAAASAPQGMTATYDPVTHLLTIAARKPVEVRVDGFLLRPVARTDKDGAQFRYVQANVLVLGQDLKQGETVTFEVVFTKPQDFYSIPIYIREPGQPAAYFTVSVSTGSPS
jgi:hypothetical protein